MPEFRQDPLTGRWVSIAPERLNRPIEFASVDLLRDESCPFCEGSEQQTPGETLAIRTSGRANEPGWRVRIVPNRYPFLSSQPDASAAAAAGDTKSPSISRPATGVHEVIIESPRHRTSVSQLSDDEMTDVVTAYRDRLRELRSTGRWRYALIFKNSGEQAGASLSHIHSQLVALPMVPAVVQDKIERSQRSLCEHGRTSWEQMLASEQTSGQRVVAETERFIALCPFASRQPYEMLLLPKSRAAHFAELADEALPELATLLKGLIARLEKIVQPLCFNWLLNTSPFDSNSQDHYHWHVEIVPRVTNWGGYEWASGYAINPVSPEDAAGQLRKAH